MSVTIAPLSSNEIAAIESIQQRFVTALRARDFDALAALYTEDAVLMPPHEPAVQGRTALKTWMSAFPPVTDFAIAVDRVEGRADLAYIRGTYTMTLQPVGAPAPVISRGKYIEIRRRQPNGEWLLEADMFSPDTP
jgi:uncharacterized protein (TIGR02246 family)